MRAITTTLFIATITFTAQAQDTNLYWGDTHVHTNNSADAFVLKNRSATPETAYRWAKGYPVIHPYHRARIQIETPLDFLVVTDHAEALGVIRYIFEGDERVAKTLMGQALLNAAKTDEEHHVFNQLLQMVNNARRGNDNNNANPGAGDPADRRAISIDVWGEIVDAAERHNDPGKFTALIGWEWTATPNGANLHRNVIMREGGDIAKQFVPFSSLDSPAPEDLWKWLAETSEKTGATFISIPHNSNISMGLMFDLVDSNGSPFTKEYAETRVRWEPIVEVTQIKGDSETHPRLSPTDEFASYEIYEFILRASGDEEVPVGSPGAYVRSALIRGLQQESTVGVNPYKFGLIGSTDAHTAVSSAEEDNFWGKTARDSFPEAKFGESLQGATGADMGAAGLAAVWATENTREAIFDAFKRREVYATTGPRIRLRVFGGWDFTSADSKSNDIARAGYEKGVPMGSDLPKMPEGAAPTFIIHAAKDPVGANLDRIQVVKGWVAPDGSPQEKIYNVALSDLRVEKDGKVKPVGNTVDLETARYTNDIGAAQLSCTWTDPDFDPGLRALYYVRVIQIPTPRHTLYDVVALQRPHPENTPPTIQERAYSSPIWYTPGD